MIDWSKVKTAEQLATEKTEAAKESVRTERDRLLAGSDWVAAVYYEKGEPVPAEWAAYRQALRDVPQQAGFPHDVVWPTKPE